MLPASVIRSIFFGTTLSSFRRLALFFSLSVCLFGIGEGRNLFTLPDELLKSVESQYGEFAKRRLLSWQALIRDDSSTSDIEKLNKVNQFFNQVQFIADTIHWGKVDYWATPVEFLSTGGGDCEDFSLAKYFTLKALGVAESKLNMTYVKALQLNQAHMVVTYYATPGAVPLVLDNLVADIQPATNRKDLIPVYSFNGSGLWLAKSRGKGQKVGSSDRLKRWQDLLARMPDGMN
ncbi:sulfate adenylyltransferase [Desulfopila sp. IMCC35006]|uniref:transglutaminase-like cysteine peptidase n=1 Tax=Desulfopila sp. IMCC35006 TaxID=2569542 RepID=UPI0010ACA7FF|nr:transglutaminase-like cysteine peptidase [Desulfopila sp. IMCC35006]TKB24766.1 sulfate adenylyltransferase [Desulfopila sp. IMCC35006]